MAHLLFADVKPLTPPRDLMSLEMRTECERCQVPLRLDGDAFICSHECTYCSDCTDALRGVCPNCGGELVPRPKRKMA